MYNVHVYDTHIHVCTCSNLNHFFLSYLPVFLGHSALLWIIYWSSSVIKFILRMFIERLVYLLCWYVVLNYCVTQLKVDVLFVCLFCVMHWFPLVVENSNISTVAPLLSPLPLSTPEGSDGERIFLVVECIRATIESKQHCIFILFFLLANWQKNMRKVLTKMFQCCKLMHFVIWVVLHVHVILSWLP